MTLCFANSVRQKLILATRLHRLSASGLQNIPSAQKKNAQKLCERQTNPTIQKKKSVLQNNVAFEYPARKVSPMLLNVQQHFIYTYFFGVTARSCIDFSSFIHGCASESSRYTHMR